MDRIILLDADIPVYKFAAAGQADANGDRLYEPYKHVVRKLDDSIEALGDQMEATRIIVCLSSDPNWRKTVLPTYKGNRKDTEDPEYRAKLKQHLLDNYECMQFPELEGDDVMGILATDPEFPGRKVIISEDKDMKTIPHRKHKQSANWLFNPAKDRKPRKVSEADADYFWMMQTLMGDSTDGYTGIPGIGEKKAEKILGPVEEGHFDLWWDLVVDAYNNRDLTMEDAWVQATVARILRAEDYDQQKQERFPW
jgi:5'-3' exonuclease